MALTPEQILDVVQPHLPQYGHSEIWKTEPEYAQCVGIEEGARWTVSELRPEHTIGAARAIEAATVAACIARLERGGQSAAVSILRHHFEQKGVGT